MAIQWTEDSDNNTGPQYPQTELLQLLHAFNGLFSMTIWVSQYRNRKISQDDRVLGCSGISWTIRKQSAPSSRQITTPAPHHSIFTGQMLLLTPNQQCQSTESMN